MGVKVSSNILYINMDGDIDHHSAALLREESDMFFNREYIKEVIFDFERTKFMDSSGIGLIMGRYRQAKYSDAKVSLINIPDNIDRMLQMSGIYKIVDNIEKLNKKIS
ncbi:MAG: anti-sigma factor antagonist [Lachnospiraceae bacterium]|nr:anti-sigma factor antagonist [Lachnospiraceae bacterium]